MDLTPKQSEPLRKPRKWLPIILLLFVSVAGVVIVAKFLGSAIDYYCNVDEIGIRSGCEETRRLRVQGTVEQNSLQKTGGKTHFVMTFNNKSINVVYAGDPGGVFQECISVVAHGRLVNDVFESNRIEVKHSNEYVEKNADRFETSGSVACSQAQG